jgi:small GTP-binding protein
MSTISRKICLFGDFGVGKTSLIRRFVEQQFSDEYLSTVGVKMSRKTIEVSIDNSQQVQEILFVIWDIEGSNKFKAIAPMYFQGAKGAIVVADITQQETLSHLKEHIQNFIAINPKSYIAIALNKSDLIEAEYLDNILQDHQNKFRDLNYILDTYLTSAKTGKNVGDIFQILAKSLI